MSWTAEDVIELLRGCRYTGGNRDEACFLSPYQIAVLLVENGLADKKIGGRGQGSGTLAEEVALNLSKYVDTNSAPKLERGFFSIKGLEKFSFDGDKEPSSETFAVFRIEESVESKRQKS
ncbi:MAG: hypothetical protein LBO82_01330 [Synergistaceae bacterium]|jgi:hypothetical protein|nr:hypothetical protein [Synergistaceae bacterium]